MCSSRQSRAARILGRMAFVASADVADDDVVVDVTSDDAEWEIAFSPRVWSSFRTSVLADVPAWDSGIAAALAVNPFLTKKIAEHLYRRIVKTDSDNALAAELIEFGGAIHLLSVDDEWDVGTSDGGRLRPLKIAIPSRH